MNKRYNNGPTRTEDTAKAIIGIKRAAVSAKIVYVGKLSYDDRQRLLNALKPAP